MSTPEAIPEYPVLPFEPVREVIVDVVAALKIAKHCSDNASIVVSGTLQGIDRDGILEVTYVFPCPSLTTRMDSEGNEVVEDDNTDYHHEMGRLLAKVNADNNWVGWYTSSGFGNVCSADVVNYHFNCQSPEDAENFIFIAYDSSVTRRGSVALKAFRLSDQFMEWRRAKSNSFLQPSVVLEEIPLKIRSVGHLSAYVRTLRDTHADAINCSYEALSMSLSDSNIERGLEQVSAAVEDLLQEQHRFQAYSKAASKPRQDHVKWLNRRLQENAERAEDGRELLPTDVRKAELPKPLVEAPSRLEGILAMAQVEQYCEQLGDHVQSHLHKVEIASRLGSA